MRQRPRDEQAFGGVQHHKEEHQPSRATESTQDMQRHAAYGSASFETPAKPTSKPELRVSLPSSNLSTLLRLLRDMFLLSYCRTTATWHEKPTTAVRATTTRRSEDETGRTWSSKLQRRRRCGCDRCHQELHVVRRGKLVEQTRSPLPQTAFQALGRWPHRSKAREEEGLWKCSRMWMSVGMSN